MKTKKKNRLLTLARYVAQLYPDRKESIDYVDIVVAVTNDLEAIKSLNEK